MIRSQCQAGLDNLYPRALRVSQGKFSDASAGVDEISRSKTVSGDQTH